MSIRYKLVEDAGRRQHAGQAGAGMRAGTDQKQPAHFLAAIVRPELGALGQDRFEPECGPTIG